MCSVCARVHPWLTLHVMPDLPSEHAEYTLNPAMYMDQAWARQHRIASQLSHADKPDKRIKWPQHCVAQQFMLGQQEGRKASQ